MNIVIKLEQRDFEGNKEVFDRMYALCGALNPRKDESAHLSKESVEKSAGVIREPEDDTEASEDVSQDTEPVSAADENVAYTIEQVRTAFSALSKSKGKEAAKGILADLGVARVPDLPKDKYAEAMARIEAVK